MERSQLVVLGRARLECLLVLDNRLCGQRLRLPLVVVEVRLLHLVVQVLRQGLHIRPILDLTMSLQQDLSSLVRLLRLMIQSAPERRLAAL